MFWVWLALAFLVGIGLGLFLGYRAAVLQAHPDIMEQKRNMASDRNFALSVLRRELANWMIRRDPARYRRAYKTAHDATGGIAAADRVEKSRQLAKLAEQYPLYIDFDLVGSRDYVLYSDALCSNSYDDIEQHYTDIIRFQALQAATNENWPRSGRTSDKELEHLDSYVVRFKDTMLRARMQAALREFNAYRKGKGDSADPDVYETTIVAVRRVAHFAELRYGIHFKDTDEFGLCGVFVDDDDKVFTGFYRSNADFTEETYLDEMVIDGPH